MNKKEPRIPFMKDTSPSGVLRTYADFLMCGQKRLSPGNGASLSAKTNFAFLTYQQQSENRTPDGKD